MKRPPGAKQRQARIHELAAQRVEHDVDIRSAGRASERVGEA